MNSQMSKSLERAVDEYKKLTPKSKALYERASHLIPGGSTRSSSFFEPYPIYQVQGASTHVWDVDGVQRIDFDCNYTVLIHGQCFPAIVQAITHQAVESHCFASPTQQEIVLAELIGARVPSIEMLRFTSSGSEAAMLAIRAARAFTGRDKIAKFVGSYHGSSELVSLNTPWLQNGPDEGDFIQAQPDGPGIARSTTETVIPLPFNDIQTVRRVLERHRGQVAAVIVEPVLGAGGLIPPLDDFLPQLQEITKRVGALLVFDEVITFRLSYGGAQSLYGVCPDLTLLGKIIGGGLPVGAVGGRRDVMSVFDVTLPGGIRHSGTYNANPMTMAAGIACLQALTQDSFCRMAELSRDLVNRGCAVLHDHRVPATISLVESLFNVQAVPSPARQHSELLGQDREVLRTLHLGLLNAGILLTPTGMGCISTVTTSAEVNAFIDALRFTLGRYFI